MRVSTQIAAIAVIGALAYGGWTYWMPQAPAPKAGAPAGQPTGAPAAPAGPAARGAGQPLLVEVATIGTGQILETTEAVGNTRAFESVSLTSKVSGVVEKITFAEGQTVKAGDELIQLDFAERRADLETARAQIMTSRAQREETSQKLERAQALRKAGAGLEANVADLTLQLRTAETNIAAAEARERSAAARLDDYTLRAPFSGRIGFRNVSLGAMLDSKVVVTTLDDVSRIRLDFSVPETYISRVGMGANVTARTLAYPDRAFEGKVSAVDTRIDPITRSAKLTAIIENADYALKPGMFMNIALQIAARENAVLAPEEAVVSEGPRQIAFVVQDGKVQRRIVSIGQRQNGMVEVTQGLAAGEVIVVRGIQRVRNGMNVQARPATPEKGSAPAADGPAAPKPEKKA